MCIVCTWVCDNTDAGDGAFLGDAKTQTVLVFECIKWTRKICQYLHFNGFFHFANTSHVEHRNAQQFL